MCALLKVTLKLYPDLDLNIQSEVSAEGAKWDTKNTPEIFLPKLHLGLTILSAWPCRPWAGLGLVMIMIMMTIYRRLLG